MKKVIFITGASSGLGKATSLYFAQQDWHVIATMRNPEQEKDLSSHPNIFITRLDVNDTTSITGAIQQGIEKFGHIDALVNNAGYGQQGIFEAVTREKIKEQFNVNVFGLMDVTRAMLPHFRSRQQGTIVNITSGAGRVTIPMISIYAASKFAVEGFTESLAYEMESQHIKVKIVEPGYILTNFHQRAANDFATDTSLKDYDNFLTDMTAMLASFGDNPTASAEDVAKTVYTAVTDGSYTLRYIAGPDLEPLIAIRNSKPDQEYVDFMRGLFMPKVFESK
jgi:NAD(P)-dependent dehydrogenase (short-subunit alcohol dehydrogenase family)